MEFDLIQIEQEYYTNSTIFIPFRTLYVIGRSLEIPTLKLIFFINDFYPRFFVEKNENIDMIHENHKDKIYEIDYDCNHKSLLKKDLVAIYTYRTDYVKTLRELFSKTYQANIRFTEVFKREKLIKGYFEVSNNIVNNKARNINLKGVKYKYLKESEIRGTRYGFDIN